VPEHPVKLMKLKESLIVAKRNSIAWVGCQGQLYSVALRGLADKA
jgi:hypothetical protein